MSAPFAFYQTLLHRVQAAIAPRVPLASRIRLALLALGILAAKSTALNQIAIHLHELHVTDAGSPASVARRLRRTLNDRHLTYATCYAPVLAQVLDWPSLLRGARRVVLAFDESSQDDRVHLWRLSLTYWGGSLPLAWRIGPQNVAQPDGYYWQQIDGLFAEAAALVPPGVEVVIVADRLYAVAEFVARCAARGWHWVVRVKTNGSYRFRDERGQEHSLAALVRKHVGQPGRRWHARGWAFKDGGWVRVHLAGHWGVGHKESVVVLSDLGEKWGLLALYERRFWCEPGFRNDKSAGWHWEQSQVQGTEHQQRLLLGMAWASLVVVSIGVAEAQAAEERERARRAGGCRSKPQPARYSVFRQGLQAVYGWLCGQRTGAVPWGLPELGARSWEEQWYQVQVAYLIVPPRERGKPRAAAPPPEARRPAGAGRILSLPRSGQVTYTAA